MTNQASEDELEQKLLDDKSFQHTLKLVPMSQRELMTFELARYIDALIRKEKLKLLAEVRERVVGENEPEFNTPKPELGNMARNRLREAQTDLLAKLEAEL